MDVRSIQKCPPLKSSLESSLVVESMLSRCS